MIPPKSNGFAHILAAARYSMGGLRRLWHETAFRHEVLLAALSFALLIALGAGSEQFLIMFILNFILFAIEAINTAIEEIVNAISPEYSQMAKHAKDLGSFAVFSALIANIAYLLIVVSKHIF